MAKELCADFSLTRLVNRGDNVFEVTTPLDVTFIERIGGVKREGDGLWTHGAQEVLPWKFFMLTDGDSVRQRVHAAHTSHRCPCAISHDTVRIPAPSTG